MPIAVHPGTGEVNYLTDAGQWEKAQTAVNPQTKEMMAFDGKDWTAVPSKSKGVFNYIDDAVRSIANGMTFGYADEIAAKMDELTGRGYQPNISGLVAGKGSAYEENLKAEHARDAQIHPAISIPGQIGGAVASTVAAAPVTGPLAAATGVAKLPAFLRAVGGGAAGGALFGSGNSEPGGRLEGAAIGGGVGAALGPAALVAGKIIGRGYDAVRGAFRPQTNVAADLGRALQRDEIAPEQFAQRVKDLGEVRPGVATAADAGGENVKGLVERIAQTPGAGRTTVVPALTGRQQGQLARISGDLSELTGTQQSAHQAVTETMEQRAQVARPLYDKAMNFNPHNAELVSAFQRETATGYGQQILRSPDFRRTLQTEYGIKDPTNAPLMVVIDAWKKGADDLVNAALRSGNNNKARVIGNMRDQLLEKIDAHNPAYAEARNAWAGPSRYMDAVTEGSNIFNTKISGEQLAAGIKNMSDAEQEAFRIGAVSAIRARMGNDPAKLGDMTKYLRSPEMREKIAAIMPNPEAAAKWNQRLNFEIGSSELTGRALGNSATARRLAEKQDSENIVGDLVMDAFMGHPPVSLLRRTIGAVPQKVRDSLRSKSDNILAELLTDPQSMEGLQRAIARVETQGKAPPSVLRLPAAVNASNAVAEEPISRQFR